MSFENIANYLPQCASKLSHSELATASIIIHHAQNTLSQSYPNYIKNVKKYAYKENILYLYVATDASFKALSVHIDAFLQCLKYTELAVYIEKIVIKKT